MISLYRGNSIFLALVNSRFQSTPAGELVLSPRLHLDRVGGSVVDVVALIVQWLMLRIVSLIVLLIYPHQMLMRPVIIVSVMMSQSDQLKNVYIYF